MILTGSKFEEIGKKVCTKIDLESGEELSAKLFKELSKAKNGIGLSAPQIGESKRVCVVNVKYPINFINPKITESEGEIVYVEGCLSYPDMGVRTKRFTRIVVEADNFDEPTEFKVGDDYDTLECICIQHEIDHLDGILMFDRFTKLEPIVSKTKIGRNEIVSITNNEEIKTLKYKKALPLLNSGDWQFTNSEVV